MIVLNDGTNAVETIKASDPVFIILDLMLPGKDGLTICREVRQFSTVPLLMLTARVDEIDRLLGPEMGVDDYVCKPFLPREVVARVRAILRRVQQPPAVTDDDNIEYRGIVLSAERFECRIGEEELDLTPVEFRMLQALVSHPGRVYSRDNLMKSSYADDRIVSDRTIDSHIKKLRCGDSLLIAIRNYCSTNKDMNTAALDTSNVQKLTPVKFVNQLGTEKR